MYVLCNSKEVQSLQKLQSQSNTSTTELLFKIVFLTKAQGKKNIFGSSFKTYLEKLKKNLIFFSFTNPRLESYRFQKFTY